MENPSFFKAELKNSLFKGLIQYSTEGNERLIRSQYKVNFSIISSFFVTYLTRLDQNPILGKDKTKEHPIL